MSIQTLMTPEILFFAVFCVESLSDKLTMPGDRIYKMLSDDSTILDSYIITHYDVLHTQGKDYIVTELIELMKQEGVLQ